PGAVIEAHAALHRSWDAAEKSGRWCGAGYGLGVPLGRMRVRWQGATEHAEDVSIARRGLVAGAGNLQSVADGSQAGCEAGQGHLHRERWRVSPRWNLSVRGSAVGSESWRRARCRS